ncbi:hypothetical protein J2X58_003135 [Luteibacter sp. 3190]|nr:hypothetical protein [Luteibacter sp. 3190]
MIDNVAVHERKTGENRCHGNLPRVTCRKGLRFNVG